MKHVLNALLCGLYYYQLKVHRQREKERKIYLPYVEGYLEMTNVINDKVAR